MSDSSEAAQDDQGQHEVEANIQRLRLFVEHAPAAIAMLDANMRYIQVSQRWLDDYRLLESDVIGRSHYALFPDIPDRWREIHERCLQGAVESNEADAFPRADGSVDWVRWEIRPWKKVSGEIGGIIIFSEVITARKEAQDELQALYEATGTLFSANTLIDLAQQIMEAVVHWFAYMDCGLVLFDRNQKVLRRLGRAGAYHMQTERLLTIDGTGLVPLAIRTGTLVYASDVALTPDYLTGDARTRSELVIPLKTSQGIIGALDLQHDKVDAFSPRDQRILTAFSERAAAAIENMQLYERLNTYAAELEKRVDERTSEFQRAKERAEAILNNSQDGILLIGSNLSIQQTNLAFNKLFGCDTSGCTGTSLLAAIYPVDADSVREQIATIVATQQGSSFEARAVRRDGSVFDVELSVGVVNSDGLTCIIRDISVRKAQERELRFHAALQQNTSDAVIVMDMGTHIQSWNKAAARIYGWSAEEAVGETTAKILRTELASPDERQRNMQRLLSQGWWQGEVRQQHKDGSILIVLSSATLIRDDKGIPFGIAAVNRDITARKQVEEDLQRSAAEIHDLYNKAPCGYHSIDANAYVAQINDTELHWLGYEREEVVGKLKIRDILTPDSFAIMEKAFAAFTERGWISDMKLDFLRKDGSVMPILFNSIAIYDEAGTYLHSRSSSFDRTQLKQAETALIESETRYRLLAENVIDVIAKINLNGIRTYITPSCYPLLGYTPDELIGNIRTDIVHPDDLHIGASAIRSAIEDGKSGFTFTQRVVHKAGHSIWVEITSSVIRNPETGEIIEFIGVMRDVTERKRTEDALTSKMETEHEFQTYLKALQDITIQLTQIDDLELFYKSTVELGREWLGFERLALFLYDPQDGSAQGTFGTDEHGKTSVEGHIRFTPSSHGCMMRAIRREERFYYDEQVPLNANNQPVGIGWNAAAIVWNGTQCLGWLVADNLLSQKPASKPLLDILALYALTIGTQLAQKQAQSALRDSEARFRQIAENFDQALFMRSVDNQELLYFNPAYEKMLGMDRDRAYQNPFAFTELVHPDDLDYVRHQMASRRSVEECLADFEYRVIPPDQQIHWVRTRTFPIKDDSGKIIRRVGIVEDVTERKRADDIIRDSEARYRLLVETMQGGLITLDVDGRMTYVNNRFCEMLGYYRDDLIGTQADDYVVNDDLNTLAIHVQRRRQLESSIYELRLRHKDGHPISVLVSGAPLIDRSGTYVGSFSVITDIGVQKRAETTLRQALAKEKELNELKTRFVSMASHEFRTPLATILTLTETLSFYRQKMTDAKIDDRLDKIKQQVDYLKDIMEDVLMLARMQSRRAEFNPTLLDLDELCSSVVEEYESRADVKHRLHYSCDGEVQDVSLDPKLMRQIVSNLISNAIKYSADESTIGITLEFTATALVLKVRDEGIGIPQEDLSYLFEPFHRATNVGTISGTGLGLAITKESVERHGGTISVESQIGAGTTFTVHLPVSDKDGRSQ
ncbi:MAG: PAS domain S-box protein [Anaerolineae bacterium]|nr:PAS domain S-box protein [Anaerolineae bacterium]